MCITPDCDCHAPAPRRKRSTKRASRPYAIEAQYLNGPWHVWKKYEDKDVRDAVYALLVRKNTYASFRIPSEDERA